MLFLIVIIITVLVTISIGLYKFRKKMYGEVSLANQLIETGVVFSVLPEEIKIKTREYSIESDVGMSRSSMLDSLYQPERNTIKENKIISVLIYEGNRNGKVVRYTSSPVYKDEISIRFYLSQQKAIKIYIDPSNQDNYYFDVSFID